MTEVWKGKTSQLEIEYSPRLLTEMAEYVDAGVGRLASGGVELGGILFGRREGDRVIVERFKAVTIEHKNGPEYSLSPDDHAKFANRVRSDGGVAVGFFRSQTKPAVTLRAADLQIFDQHFPQGKSIAILLAPGETGGATAMLYARVQQGSRPHEGPMGAIPVTYRQGSIRLKDGLLPPLKKKEKRKIPWTSVLTAASLMIIAGHLTGMWLMPFRPAPPVLSLVNLGSRIRVEWDTSNEAVRSATRAEVSIHDGDKRNVIELKSADLAEKNYLFYDRHSNDVQVTMTVWEKDDRRGVFNIRFEEQPAPKKEEDTLFFGIIKLHSK